MPPEATLNANTLYIELSSKLYKLYKDTQYTKKIGFSLNDNTLFIELSGIYNSSQFLSARHLVDTMVFYCKFDDCRRKVEKLESKSTEKHKNI